MITTAFLGCGHIHTPGFIRMLAPRGDVRVKWVWDHDRPRAEKRAGELKAAVADRVETVLGDAEVSAVIVASETDRHAALVVPAAQAGKHLFVEKPLGLSAVDAGAMADAIERAGVLFQTGYFMRSAPIHRFLKQEIDAGRFGKITRVRASNCHSGALGGWFDTEWRWMADLAQAGCGAFGDLGTHALDILIWLLGPIDAVAALTDRGTGRYGATDETGEALLRFRSGVIGALAAAWDDLANPASLIISGTEAHAAVINGQLFYQCAKAQGADGKAPWTQLPPGLPHAFELFFDRLAGKDAPLVGAREAAYRNAVFDAIYAAARSRAWVAPGAPG